MAHARHDIAPFSIRHANDGGQQRQQQAVSGRISSRLQYQWYSQRKITTTIAQSQSNNVGAKHEHENARLKANIRVNFAIVQQPVTDLIKIKQQ